MESRGKIAVIGAGVAGITAAYILQREYQVTLFEKNNYVGGHTNTVVLEEGPDKGLPVDTGFIVLNDQTYPNFHRLLRKLSVSVRESEMSFGYYCKMSGLQYAGTTLSGLFAQRSNLFSKKFLRILVGIVRFCRQARLDLENETFEEISLADYLKKHQFSSEMIDHYLIPMAAAIWSGPRETMFQFPAKHFCQFFRNHGLLSLVNRPTWQTVVGGSHAYVKKFLADFKGELRTEAKIRTLVRESGQVIIYFEDGSLEQFDKVVIATHADEALKLLAEPTELEARLLGAWSYQANDVVLHTDSSVLPSNRRAWASWNYVRELDSDEGAGVSVTYHMNRLQGFESERNYCVTLNRSEPVKEEKLIRRFVYTHPVYTCAAMKTQTELPQINGVRETYFCGSYFGYGFHEDAVRSAVKIAECFSLGL